MERVFGAPQDVEWAIDDDEPPARSCSRDPSPPSSGACPAGPIYGPGPVAETFPEPLTELEHDLWVPPLRDAVREAVLLAGTASRRDVAATEVVVSVHGHVGIDLRLAGDITPRLTLWRTAQPAPAGPPPASARGGSAGSAPRCPASPSTSSTEADADLEAVPPLDRAHEPPAHRACSTAARRCSGPCTPTRSSWAC